MDRYKFIRHVFYIIICIDSVAINNVDWWECIKTAGLSTKSAFFFFCKNMICIFLEY